MKRFTVLCLIFAALIFACRKNTDDTTQREKGPIPSLNVESALIGKVVDANGNPVVGAAVAVAGLSLTSNDEGVFVVQKKLLDNNGTLVSVVKTGFFEAARFAFPHLNGIAHLEIQLLPKNLALTFDAAAGGTVPIGQGATATIPANALVTPSGALYQGPVRAYAVWLDPTAAETFRTMPGDLRAIDVDGFPKVLKTYGMVGVELESPSGTKLNLATDKKANISLPVPASMRGSAPTSIPLWHFNTANGYWEEAGAATLLNGTYKGEVDHFSFWNCDVPANYIKLKMSFSDGNGAAVSGLQVQLVSQGFGTGAGYTDNNGFVGGLVPANETFQLAVLNPCGNTVYQDNIGPFNADTDLGKITVAGLSILVVSGKLQDCDNAPVGNGMVALTQGNLKPVYTVTNATGGFSFSLIHCAGASNVALTGYNLDDATESTLQTIALTGALTDAGTIQVCTALDEYVIVTCNGSTQTYLTNPRFDVVDINGGFLSAFGPILPGVPDSMLIYLLYGDLQSNQTAGTLSYVYFHKIENNVFKSYGCSYCTSSGCNCVPADVNPITFTIFPNKVGDYAQGSVSGKIRAAADNALLPFTLNFRLKRTR